MQDLSTLFTGGYFDIGSEDRFPWHSCDRSVWYALFSTVSGKQKATGFTPSYANKRELVEILKNLPDDDRSVLVGVWNGQYYTSLFPLQRSVAISKLQEDLTAYDNRKREQEEEKRSKIAAAAKAKQELEAKREEERRTALDKKRETDLLKENAAIIAKVVTAPKSVQKMVAELIDKSVTDSVAPEPVKTQPEIDIQSKKKVPVKIMKRSIGTPNPLIERAESLGVKPKSGSLDLNALITGSNGFGSTAACTLKSHDRCHNSMCTCECHAIAVDVWTRPVGTR